MRGIYGAAELVQPNQRLLGGRLLCDRLARAARMRSAGAELALLGSRERMAGGDVAAVALEGLELGVSTE